MWDVTVLQIVLNFCQMNNVFGGHFLGFCFSESIFLGVLSVAKGRSGIPNYSADPRL